MQIPEYTGHPLSILARITTPEADIPLWIWAPVGITLEDTPNARDHLVSSGYELLPQTGNRTQETHLYTQLYEVEHMADTERVNTQLWTKPDNLKQVTKHPVTLAFSQEITAENNQLPMLQFLPMPHVGEYGLLDGTDKPAVYNIAQLPVSAQERWKTLQVALLSLADPGAWIPHDPQIHPLCSEESFYQRLLTNTRTHALRDQAKKYIARLEEAHQQVISLRQSWLKQDWILRWREITHMAQELAADYHAYHQELTRTGNKPIPDIANAFSMGVTEIFTHQPFQAYPAAAIARTGEWRQEPAEKENELILSYRRAKPSGTTFVQIREQLQGDQSRETALARMWEQQNKLSDLDADVNLAMIAQLYAGVKDEEGYTWISADKMLGYRGIKPKKNKNDPEHKYTGGHRWEDIEDIAACIKRMENVYIKVHEQEIIDSSQTGNKRKRTSRTTISRESRLFVFGDVIYHNQLPLDGSPGKSIPIAWQYRESSWMLPFMEGPNRFVGKLFQKVLNYDPYHQKWEKRLSRYLMFWLRTNAKYEVKRHPTVHELLTECRLDIEEDRPQRTRDRFEKAMDQIQADGLLTWDYEKEIEIPTRKWLPTWLQQKIVVEDPPMLKSQYMSIAATAKVIRSQNRVTRRSEGKKRPQS